MDNKVKEQPDVQGKGPKPQKPGVMEQALAHLNGAIQIEYQKESWWSIIVFWVQELRWRRIFWESKLFDGRCYCNAFIFSPIDSVLVVSLRNSFRQRKFWLEFRK
jgi:hypothetical protein